MASAKAVLKQLNAGMDFSVLAKEKSTDAMASDGAYMGKVDPDKLRTELRDALRDRRLGQLTSVVQLPWGFAILKVLTTAPATGSLNAKRTAAPLATDAIRRGPAISGITEANLALSDYPKPNQWLPDLHTVCEVRKASQANAKKVLIGQLSGDRTAKGGDDVELILQKESALAQLYTYSGDMEKSIEAWKAA